MQRNRRVFKTWFSLKFLSFPSQNPARAVKYENKLLGREAAKATAIRDSESHTTEIGLLFPKFCFLSTQGLSL
jgi:hypothetical protein